MKLIDLLVKELPQRGGWPCGVDAVEQDCEGQLFEMESDYCSDFKLEKCDDWIADVVTKQQYESALAASKAVVGHNGWIQWDGGECPVEEGVLVDIRIRNGKESHGVRANEITKGVNPDASHPFWRKDGNGGDIIAYRLQQHGINAHANDDQLEQDLNQCIGQYVDMPEWNGEGLPPVGIKCEHCPGGTTQHEWEVVTVAGVHENTSTGFTDYWLVRENGSSYIVGNPYRFRPLRTEAERKRDIAIEAILSDMRTIPCDLDLRDEVAVIYDAIAAGKIPGVKLEDK